MTETLEKVLKKESKPWAYVSEATIGGVVIFAKQIFDFQGDYAIIAEVVTTLGGLGLVLDGYRRMANTITDYRTTIQNHLDNK
ncbi:hypothetical protein HOE37_05930 [Candidatus Woesearchaeota archaeon]|jgi:hypothetical protein|nr:hypothetical protein [Candidatus Woesearchaeota archaeon]MBT4111373.1 hypothetical protein [Candidatus Woesearchaeota archaeon]MBT4336448.1 hypothetical protein [Candidatus Woesearchaeota archaeon]MBT4469861.1 hypothetical protein [Candidatus Woesearchaeota archaeon]MBT6744468.1 hypothetical protein [Candidatus Woesearchaeota archaeon]